MKNLEDFLARAAFQELAMVLKTSYRLLTPLRRPKLKRSVFRRIIFSGFRQSKNDVFNLGVTKMMSGETKDKELYTTVIW